MATGKILRQLIKSGVEGNSEAFRAAAEEVIREERAEQHDLLANHLKVRAPLPAREREIRCG